LTKSAKLTGGLTSGPGSKSNAKLDYNVIPQEGKAYQISHLSKKADNSASASTGINTNNVDRDGESTTTKTQSHIQGNSISSVENISRQSQVQHKHTKSEPKLMKDEIIFNTLGGGTGVLGGTRGEIDNKKKERGSIPASSSSQQQQVYTYNHNNIVNIFLNEQQQQQKNNNNNQHHRDQHENNNNSPLLTDKLHIQDHITQGNPGLKVSNQKHQQSSGGISGSTSGESRKNSVYSSPFKAGSAHKGEETDRTHNNKQFLQTYEQELKKTKSGQKIVTTTPTNAINNNNNNNNWARQSKNTDEMYDIYMKIKKSNVNKY
jgi:hypothetical protein